MCPADETHVASCSCGQLRATAVGAPVVVSVCHCLACQRRTGSPFGQQARFEESSVQIDGRAREYVRHADDDGEPRTFSFCPECGSNVYFRSDGQPGLVAIPVGAFAEPSFPGPTRSVWEERRHAWVTMPEGIEHRW